MISQSRLVAREFARRLPDGADIFRLPKPPGARPTLLEAVVIGLCGRWPGAHAPAAPTHHRRAGRS